MLETERESVLGLGPGILEVCLVGSVDVWIAQDKGLKNIKVEKVTSINYAHALCSRHCRTSVLSYNCFFVSRISLNQPCSPGVPVGAQ